MRVQEVSHVISSSVQLSFIQFMSLTNYRHYGITGSFLVLCFRAPRQAKAS